MDKISTLGEAVSHFVASLHPPQRTEIRELVLNSQITSSVFWYKRVVADYLSSADADKLIEDIGKRHADEAVWREMDSPAGQPFFEAGIILRHAQALLK
jgi:hypothetical protein